MCGKGMHMKTKSLAILKTLFLLTNLVQAGGLALFIYLTTDRICRDDQARVFIGTIRAIPKYPPRMMIIVITLLCILSANMLFRDWIRQPSARMLPFSLLLDLLCSLILIWTLDFNYNGVILLVFANVILYTNGHRLRYILIAIATGAYLTADYDLLSVSHRLFSIRSYIQYYDASSQQLLFSFYNILSSLNIMIFILYCINIINQQKNTIDEVNEWSKQLQDANARLKEYNKMTEKMAQTRERNRIAREIHDTLGHILTGVSAGVDACIALIDVDTTQTKKQLEVIAKAVRGGIKDVRRSVSELRADALEHFQLDTAIKEMIEEMNSLAKVEVSFTTDVHPFRFSDDEENVIYRIVQEGITNALRHGKATKITITANKKDGILNLQIKDNGVGCEQPMSGFGTKHMKERVRMLGGSIRFDGSDGFLIDAQIPIRWGESYD